MVRNFRRRTETYFKNGKGADDYDTFVKRNIPFYGQCVDLLAREVTAFTHTCHNILDLGCGTGNFGVEVASRSNARRLYLVDHSRAMLKLAKQKCELAGLNATYICASFAGKQWTRSISESIDVCCSCFTLDHLWDDRILVDLANTIRLLLSKGGVWYIVEKFSAANPNSPSRQAFRRMIDIRYEHAISQKLKSRASADLWRDHILREDCVRPIREVLGFANGAGFNLTGAWGVKLPDTSALSSQWFYDKSNVTPLDIGGLQADESAYGVAILALRASAESHEESSNSTEAIKP